jgi:hypothetical protein
MLSADDKGRRSRLVVRTMGQSGLGPTATVLESRDKIVDVSVRPASNGRPAEALVTTDCDGRNCVKHLFAWSSHFVGSSTFTAVKTESARLERVEKSLMPTTLPPGVYRYLRLETVEVAQEAAHKARASNTPAARCDADPNRCA